jgi:hypothetical protein
MVLQIAASNIGLLTDIQLQTGTGRTLMLKPACGHSEIP